MKTLQCYKDSLQRFWSKLVDHVAAGEKLIDHLKKWVDTTKLLETPHSAAQSTSTLAWHTLVEVG